MTRLFVVLCFCSTSVFAQSYLTKDSLKVKVERVIDGDTYVVVYRKESFTVRARMPDPHDTLDTFDTHLKQARKQAARYGITVDSVRVLSEAATHFMDSLLTGKKVVLRKYPDQLYIGTQFSYGRLLRGVELHGVNVGELLPPYLRSK